MKLNSLNYLRHGNNDLGFSRHHIEILYGSSISTKKDPVNQIIECANTVHHYAGLLLVGGLSVLSRCIQSIENIGLNESPTVF